jgi:hypothetical protein
VWDWRLWSASHECSSYDQAFRMGSKNRQENQRETRSGTYMDMEDEDIRTREQQFEARISYQLPWQTTITDIYTGT